MKKTNFILIIVSILFLGLFLVVISNYEKNIILNKKIKNLENIVSTLETKKAEMKELRKLECDLETAFYAERRYTYPILRGLGYDPDNYGKAFKNPLTTELEYVKRCIN